jgi:hypothetical protein
VTEKIVDDKVIVDLPKDWLPQENGAQADGKEPGPKRELSPGEVVFDKVTYTGISFILNEVISLWMTDKFLYGSWKQHSDNLSTKLAPVISKNKPFAEGKKDAHGVIMAFMLNMGGNFLVPVMKKAEDYKLPIVTWLNHKIDDVKGNKLTPEQVAERDKEVTAHIHAEPDQTWGAMIPARILVPTQSMLFSKYVLGGDRTKKIENWVGDKVSGTLARQNSKALQSLGKNQRFIGIAKLIPFETLFCAGGAITFYLTSRMFAKHGHKKKMAELAAANGASEPSTKTAPQSDAGTAAASGGTDDRQERSLVTEPAKESPKERVLARQNLDDVIGSLPADAGNTKMLDKVISRQVATAEKGATTSGLSAA